MDQTRFQEAQEAYTAGEYRTAAKGFLASASRGPDGNGAAYHMAGNALIRLRRFQDAVTVYGHALRDQLYDRRGAVWANLGKAYCELGDYAEAARAYECALEEPDYATPYKAYQGMAGALLERNRVEDAAVAYRKAALDPGNPDPGKALVNLGLCFMGLNRPGDAVEAYRAALGFDQYKGRGKALANLGQAHVALGQYEDAVKAFDKATQMHGHMLSPAAATAFALALSHVEPAPTPADIDALLPSLGSAEDAQPAPALARDADSAGFPAPLPAAPAPEAAVPTPSAPQPAQPFAGIDAARLDFAAQTDEAAATPLTPASAPAPAPPGSLTDGWLTGSMTMGWDALADPQAMPAEVPAEPLPDIDFSQPLAPFDHVGPGADVDFGDDESVADFFSATDEELKARDKEARRAARHERGPFAILRTVGIAILAVALVAGLLVGAYALGYGWPTQSQTVSGLLIAVETGNSVDSYWVAAPSKDIKKEMAKIPPVKSFTIDNVAQSATTSKANVTVTPATGAALHYTITLSREGVGWKVSGVDNDWSSTGG